MLGVILSTLGIIILLAVATVCAVIAYALLKSAKPRIAKDQMKRCTTLALQTSDIIEIVTRDGTETITVTEYAGRRNQFGGEV
jgi:hypothetical protein